jgi:hypothetical protein
MIKDKDYRSSSFRADLNADSVESGLGVEDEGSAEDAERSLGG